MKAVVFLGVMLAASSARALSEPRKTETGLPEKWAGGMTLVLDPSLETLGAGATDTVRQALGTWLADVAHVPNVTFVVGTSPMTAKQDGVNVVLAGPVTTPGKENALALTTTYALDSSGDILEADIVFNTAYTFGDLASLPSCAQTYDLASVATHEAGHFFGLDEDYTDLATTMFITTEVCDLHKRVLTPSDTNALEDLYAPPTTVVAQCNLAPPKPSGSSPMLVFVALSALTRCRKWFPIKKRGQHSKAARRNAP